MNLQISNLQKKRTLNLPAVRRLATLLFIRAMRLAPTMNWSSVTLVLTDDTGIAGYKEAAFGYREITDVVTLVYEPSPADPDFEGEVFVNVERAFSRPCRRNWSPARELALYIAHGFDHLTGADDQTTDERLRMRRRELQWISRPECLEATHLLAK